jgi:hypothetical protein
MIDQDDIERWSTVADDSSGVLLQSRNPHSESGNGPSVGDSERIGAYAVSLVVCRQKYGAI